MDFMVNKFANWFVDSLNERLYDLGFSATPDYDSQIAHTDYTEITIKVENDDDKETVLSFSYHITTDYRPKYIILQNKEIDINDLDSIVNAVMQIS